MPKERRRPRQQQHLRQQAPRKKSYTLGGHAAEERYKPGFPMNLMQHQTAFWLIGAVIMVGSIIVAALLAGRNPSRTSADVPTRTPTPTVSATVDPNSTVTPAATPTRKTFAQADQVVDPSKKYTATIKTDKGDIVMDLFADKSPRTVNTFVFLAQQKYFDGTLFYRVDPGFVVQTGAPENSTSGAGPGFKTEEDANDLSNKRGYVSMAKAGATTQFSDQWFINLSDNNASALDVSTAQQKRFYPFGKIRDESMAIVQQLTKTDVMRSVTISQN